MSRSIYTVVKKSSLDELIKEVNANLKQDWEICGQLIHVPQRREDSEYGSFDRDEYWVQPMIMK